MHNAEKDTAPERTIYVRYWNFQLYFICWKKSDEEELSEVWVKGVLHLLIFVAWLRKSLNQD